MKKTRSIICFLLAAITMIVMVCPVAASAKTGDKSSMSTGSLPRVTDPNAYVVTCSKLNVRSGPGTKYSVIGSLNRGATVRTVDENGFDTYIEPGISNWVRILYNGDFGYCNAIYLDEVRFNGDQIEDYYDTTYYGCNSPTDYVNVLRKINCSTKLNVRQGPGTAWPVVGTLERGAVILRISDVNNGWTAIHYKDVVAYCKTSYLENVNISYTNDMVETKNDVVTLVGPSIIYAMDKINQRDYLSKDQIVHRVGTVNGYSIIWYNNRFSYCLSSHFSVIPSDPIPSNPLMP